MKIGDLVYHFPAGDEMTHLLYEAEGIPADFTLGIVLDIETQIPPAATHIQVYADNGVNWYSISDLEKIK